MAKEKEKPALLAKGTEVVCLGSPVINGRRGRIRHVHPDSLWPYDVDVDGCSYPVPLLAGQVRPRTEGEFDAL